MIRFAAAGYVCIDYYPQMDNRCYVTGNGVDVLFNLLDMRSDLCSSVVSAISDDTYGKMAVEVFSRKGIDCSQLDIIPGGVTPCVDLYLKNGYDRVHNTFQDGVMTGYQFSEEAIEFLSRQDYVHTDFTGRLIPQLSRIRKGGAKIFFDLSFRHEHEEMETVLSNIEVGLCSFEDNIEEGKEFLRYGCILGAKAMIATFGEKGSLVYDGKEFYRGEIVPAKKVVNTVGAGDSYFAGFISGWMDGKPIPECIQSGALRSSKVVGVFHPYLEEKHKG